jgi:peptidyl-tRNA hydrolase, PTH1 family
MKSSGHLIVGLGNPGEEYENTRHNTGRMLVERLHATHKFGTWLSEKKPKMTLSEGVVADRAATLVLPDTFMNKSGHAVAHFIKSKKGAGNLIVVHDELDMPIGTMKVSFGRSSGGHNGIESVIKALKTNEFVRIRIGVSPKSAKGVARKPSGEDKVLKFLLGRFTAGELTELKKVFKRAMEAVETIVRDGHQQGMNQFN